jgi:hypothetical protein
MAEEFSLAMKWLVSIVATCAGIAAGWWSRDFQTPDSPTSATQRIENIATPSPESVGPLAKIQSALRMKPGLQQFAALSEPLARLGPEAIGALIESVEREGREQRDYRSGWLFKWWLQRDPEAASAWVMPRLQLLVQDGPLGTGTNAEADMADAWAKAFPQRALKLAREYPRAAIAGTLLYHAAHKRRDAPPIETWAIFSDFPEGPARAKEASRFLSEWAKKDAGSAFAAAQSLNAGQTRDQALEAVLPLLAATDTNLAFEHYERLGLSNPELVNKMIVNSGSKDPASVAKWLTQLHPAQFAQVATPFLEKWAAKDPAAAFSWAVEHGARLSMQGQEFTEMRHHGFGRNLSMSFGRPGPDALKAAMTAQPEAALGWLRSLPQGAQREQMAERFLSYVKPEDAVRLFKELGPGSRGRAISTMGSTLSGDPKRATEWVATLTAGPERQNAWYRLGQFEASALNPPVGAERDAWLEGRVIGTGFLSRTPAETLNMVMEIQNAQKQREAFDQVMEAVKSDNAKRVQAVTWMEKSKLPEAWKAKWRVSQPGSN